MKHNKLNKYNPRAPNKIDTKNVMLKYLKMIEDMLIEMFSSPTIIRKISNTSYKGYVCDKLRKELNSGDTRHAEAVLDSFKFKRREKPQEIIAEKVKLMPQKKIGTGIKILTLNKLLTRLPVLLAQIKGGNNSYRLKNKIRQILYLSHQYNKITKKS